MGNYRWSICGLLFCSVALNYIDRNIIGILKGPLSKELGWSETDYAHIASAFQFAYAFGYLFGGRLMDWIVHCADHGGGFHDGARGARAG